MVDNLFLSEMVLVLTNSKKGVKLDKSNLNFFKYAKENLPAKQETCIKEAWFFKAYGNQKRS